MKSESNHASEEVENIYNLEEGESEGSPSEGFDPNPEEPRKRKTPLELMFGIMLNPVEGWKSLRRSKYTPDEISAKCFYPLSALAAASQFVALVYHPDMEMSDILVKALITFICFFFGNFIILPLLKILLPKSIKDFSETDFGKEFVMMMLSTLALFYVAITLLPMIEPVLVFLPLWTIYLISKGTKFIKIPKDKTVGATGMLCVVIIGTPLLVNWIFTSILP